MSDIYLFIMCCPVIGFQKVFLGYRVGAMIQNDTGNPKGRTPFLFVFSFQVNFLTVYHLVSYLLYILNQAPYFLTFYLLFYCKETFLPLHTSRVSNDSKFVSF